MKNLNRGAKDHVISGVVSLVFIALAFVIYFNQQFIRDSYAAYTFKVTPQIEELTSTLKLTPEAKRYFYATHPKLTKTNEASRQCSDSVEKTVSVLGCYANGVIYIYDVDNTELKHVEEVTAAHELLHAAYERLPITSKANVRTMLLAEYEKLKLNPKFSERMSVYNKLPDDQFINELHSVIGTEVGAISHELEIYYKKYFVDRAAITTMHAKYISVYETLQKEMDDLTARYNEIVTARNAIIDALNKRHDALNKEIERVNRLPSVSSAVARATNAKIDAYNTEYYRVKDTVAKYDEELKTLQSKIDSSLAHQIKLNEVLDSSLAPPVDKK